jgi:phasin
MANDTSGQFDMPNDLRALAEQSVRQARKAIDGLLQNASETVEQLEGRAEAVQTGARDIAKRSMAYAEQNVAASFDFAEKLVHARDAAEIVRLQTEFLGRQINALSAQAQDFGRTAAKVAAEAVNVRR